MSLFLQHQKKHAILLVDTTGSTEAVFSQGKTVFDKFCDVVLDLGYENYRFIFWNSMGITGNRMKDGVAVIPFVVKQQNIAVTFTMAKQFPRGATYPHLGFRAIPVDWLAPIDGVFPTVFLLTDGQISGGQSDLVQEIRKLNNPFSVIAVEAMTREFATVENVRNAAGGDIFNLLQLNNLTGKINEFISHCQNAVFTQISKIKAPAGHASFGDQYFSTSRVREFIVFLKDYLQNHPSETDQLDVAQKLSVTLECLTKDRPKNVADDIIRTFCSMFSLEKEMVRYIISEAIENERRGQAQVFAHYRTALKDLFKRADAWLKQDTASAVGFASSNHGMCISLPYIDDEKQSIRVLTSSYRNVDSPMMINTIRYPRAAFKNVPMFPMLSPNTVLPELQDQCLRQWLRAVFAARFNVNVQSDDIIWLVMLTSMIVCKQPNVRDEMKNAWRALTNCMLRKKRLNSQQTEGERLYAGEFPMPNTGLENSFFVMMNSIIFKFSKMFETAPSPMALWKEMCKAHDPLLAQRQTLHFAKEDVQFSKYVFTEDVVPISSIYDYTCPITLNDVSSVGGFHVMEHISPAGAQCSPVYIFSAEGKNTMFVSAMGGTCPVCYASLTTNNFAPIGAKINFSLPEAYNVYEGYWRNATQLSHSQPSQVYQSSSLSNNRQSISTIGIRNKNGKTGTLLILRGTVGSGKTTYAERISNVVKARGGYCMIVGTDKHTKTGLSPQQAVENVIRELSTISTIENDDLVVIIDTCNDTTTATKNINIFKTNFEGWKTVIEWPNYNRNDRKSYMAWSLYNVLLRGEPNSNTSFYLSPYGGKTQLCKDVHQKKCKNLFGKNVEWNFSNDTVDSLKMRADAYAVSLPQFVCIV